MKYFNDNNKLIAIYNKLLKNEDKLVLFGKISKSHEAFDVRALKDKLEILMKEYQVLIQQMINLEVNKMEKSFSNIIKNFPAKLEETCNKKVDPNEGIKICDDAIKTIKTIVSNLNLRNNLDLEWVDLIKNVIKNIADDKINSGRCFHTLANVLLVLGKINQICPR